MLRSIISAKSINKVNEHDGELKKLLKKSQNKSINQVDRRASKGRKIRYEYLTKLQNFMVPINRYDPDFLVDELFTNLFAK